MVLRNLTRKEKMAVLKSLITIAGADGHISNSENSYLGIFLLKMGEDESIIGELRTISNDETIRLLRNLNYNDKQDLLYLWVEMAVKSDCNMIGAFRIKDLREAKDTIISLARLCNIDIDLNKEYAFYY